MKPDRPFVAVENLTFGYGAADQIFAGFSVGVPRGAIWAVIGHSGCGKSTLLYLLAGLHRPDAGRILIDGEPLMRPRPQTGLVLQDHGLLPWATARENVRLGLDIRSFYGPDGTHAPRRNPVDKHRIASRVDEWMARLKIAHLADKFPAQLSRGQRQRAAIARTLALCPDLLMLDEPFSALDAPTREELQQLLIDLRGETGLTVLMVTHDIEEAVRLGEQVLVLKGSANRAHDLISNAVGAGADGAGGQTLASACQRVRNKLGRQS